jgi:Fe-S cluster biosynthesis and repair protein YggX
MSIVHCSRCRLDKEGVSCTAFYRGEVHELLKANACADCWRDWVKMQLMLINEYRLNLMDPRTDEFLNKQVLAFFMLAGEDESARIENTPEM